MGAKSGILKRVLKNRPRQVDLPTIPEFVNSGPNLLDSFLSALKKNGGQGIVIDKHDLSNVLKEEAEGRKSIYSSITHLPSSDEKFDNIKEASELEAVDLAIIKGELGVSENGAIWIPENNLTHRAIPFITQHLIIVLDAQALVSNMHEAYDKIDISKGGYGVFIAGPSKTADIEQSLVIGAHGARSLKVFIL